MAHSAMAGSGWGTTEGDDPLQTAVWRLRSRACWADAAALLEPVTAATALQRTALLVERCLYTEQGWADAEDALRTAEALAHSDEERGAAACERGQLAYAATVHGVRDRSDEARAALGRAAALVPPGAAGRALLDFRRGLLAENLARSPQAARAAYRRAHAGATAHADPLLQSFTWRHLAGLALREGGVGRGPAWLRRVAADPGGTGLPRRHGTGAGVPGRRGVRAGGVPAARGGATAVPPARRCTDVAGPPSDTTRTGRGDGLRTRVCAATGWGRGCATARRGRGCTAARRGRGCTATGRGRGCTAARRGRGCTAARRGRGRGGDRCGAGCSPGGEGWCAAGRTPRRTAVTGR